MHLTFKLCKIFSWGAEPTPPPIALQALTITYFKGQVKEPKIRQKCDTDTVTYVMQLHM